MIVLWTFKGYVNERGHNVIDEWYDSLPLGAQNKLDWIIKMIEVRHRADWKAKFFKPYKGSKDIYEFRFEINKIAYRPLGAFGPGKGEYTLLVGAKKVNNILDPKDAPNIALRRLDTIRDSPKRAKECEFEDEETEISSEIN
jgi:hypothetical protein